MNSARSLYFRGKQLPVLMYSKCHYPRSHVIVTYRKVVDHVQNIVAAESIIEFEILLCAALPPLKLQLLWPEHPVADEHVA